MNMVFRAIIVVLYNLVIVSWKETYCFYIQDTFTCGVKISQQNLIIKLEVFEHVEVNEPNFKKKQMEENNTKFKQPKINQED